MTREKITCIVSGYNVAIAINDHANEIAYIEIDDVDKVINYLQKVKDNRK